MLYYISRESDLRAAVQTINQANSDEVTNLVRFDTPVAGQSNAGKPSTRQLLHQSARTYQQSFQTAKTCLQELRSILLDKTEGILGEIRDTFHAACEAHLKPVKALLDEMAEHPEYQKAATKAIADLTINQKGGIYYLSKEEVENAIERVLERLLKLEAGEAAEITPSALLSSLVDDHTILRSLIDVVISEGNQKYAEGIQNTMRMVASMNGCPDKTLDDLKRVGSPLSTTRQFKTHAHKQLINEQLSAMLHVLARDPPVVVGAFDNYFRTFKNQTETSVLYGSWGTMNLTNHIARVPARLPGTDEEVKASIQAMFESGVGKYDGIWGETTTGYLLQSLLSMCNNVGEGAKAYGGGFERSILMHEGLDEYTREFALNMLKIEACNDSLKALEPAFGRSMMHGTVSQDESLEGLMQRIFHIGLVNIDSNSKAGCLEMVRMILTYPACRFHILKGRLFTFSGDIALFYPWLTAVLMKLYPEVVLKHIVFVPDMFLHPLIKLNKVIWGNYGGIISRIFNSARVGLGKFMENVRLSTSRVWLSLTHEALIQSEELKRLLAELKTDFSSDPGVISLSMFLEQHVPLAVALSNCMEQAKSDAVQTRRAAFDTLYRVLLPAMAHSFFLLKSPIYR